MNKPLLLLSLAFMLLSACQKQPVKSSVNPVDSIYNQVDWHPLPFQYLVLKSKIDFTSKESNIHVTANIRVKKDSVIWISLTPGMGIEAIRSLITPDSVKIINRLENKYDKYSISYIKETLGVDLDFYNLQNLIVGDLLLPINEQDLIKNNVVKGLWEVIQTRETLSAINTISIQDKKLTRLEAQNNARKYIRVDYTEFDTFDSLVMHQTQSVLLVNAQDSSFIETHHQKIEFPTKDLSFPFSVPKKYEK